ncbi:MORC family CW-type zinc finger protein 3 [Nymphaea thermarum]|nr:MORC family CW-type zinc finger protein 3 [Nymphaea thermarum]
MGNFNLNEPPPPAEGNHLERCKLEEVPASRNLRSHTNSKFILPMEGHDVDNKLKKTARLVQTCDVSGTFLRDSLLHDSHCIEDDPEVLSSAAEEKNILCPSPAYFLEEIAESSHRVAKETQISPTRESSDKHRRQSSAVEPTLRDWKSHFVAEDPEQIKASEYKKNNYMQFVVDGNVTESNAFVKQSPPLAVLHMRNYGSRSMSQTDFSSPTVEYSERNQGFNPITRQANSLSQSYVRTHPSYFKTLGQIHSGWIFGAIAELVDNARDANAKRLEIFIESMYSKREGKHIPVLSFVDNGCGMSHKEIVRMVSFGHEPRKNDANHIGRYGVGFKTGAMRLGRNALVISQASNSRSLAFLSQAFNEDKNDFEIPIVSYARQGNFMDIDTNIQTEAEATAHLKSIKEFSPFNEYFIGEKSALFGKNGTGTQIYIWDLDKWGSDYSLEWTCDDIMIRSKRVRTRAGQISNEPTG